MTTQTEQQTINAVELTAIKKLTRDLKMASATLSKGEARFLVDNFYAIQEYRKASGNQVRALTTSNQPEPCEVIGWLNANMEGLENQIKGALDAWTSAQEVGKWAKSVVGIGPVITAGLLAHIDIAKAPTVGHIWRFAGLDPTLEWLGNEKAKKLVEESMAQCNGNLEAALVYAAGKCNIRPDNLRVRATTKPKSGKPEEENGIATGLTVQVALTQANLISALAKRPWNASLKTLCWKIGESFVKVCNHEKDYYGKLYIARKQFEQERNEAGYNKPAAEKALQKKIGKSTDAYAAYIGGKLPPAHIHARAKRWAVKLFIAHLHHVMYKVHYQTDPPLPYVIAHMGHVDHILPPNF